MRKILLFSGFCLFALAPVRANKPADLVSPDGNIRVACELSDKIRYDVFYKDELILNRNVMKMKLTDLEAGVNPVLKSEKRSSADETVIPVVPMKFSVVRNHYNSLLLSFKGDYSVEFRAYDDGIACRFITDGKKKETDVISEDFTLGFPENYMLHMQQPDSFKTSCEEEYAHMESDKWQPEERMAFLPLLIDTKKGCKILFSESGLRDYPCMFLRSTAENGLCSVFPKVPLEVGEDGDRSQKILKEADYIARTSGKRTYPWRYLLMATDDRRLIENTMPCRLGGISEIPETSWIKPGQASWEWWNGATPYGADVDFEAGCNANTYKYYIDFAARYGIPYIILDEGWALSTRDPYTPNPDLDLQALIRYGKERQVGIVLWLTWLTVENHFDLFKTFGEWGVKGLKIDFMDRSDQWMVNFYERVAKEAAKYRLLVDFHGAFKPAGLEYRYPNVLSYEGVRGMEQMGNCKPENSLYLPFIRNAVGAMDYTPGAMISMQPESYCSRHPNAASIGTRAYQMALFVVFESGLQMLADNPVLYCCHDDCTRFITQVPVTWDETRALEAEAGEFVVVAKRKGHRWFVGGITNDRKREFCIPADFLAPGVVYKMVSFEDGPNAGRQAMDYRKREVQIKSDDMLTVKMVRNGGFAAVIEIQ